jgi:serine/threonine protein kinase
MEPIEGRPLAEFLFTDARAHVARAKVDLEGKLPLERAMRWAAELAAALARAHAAGIVHGHVNPDNVIVNADDTIAILTASALRLPAASTHAANLAATGRSVRLNYLAPEQIRGEPAGAASDVFAFGAVAFVIFTGQEALPADTGEAELLKLDPLQASDLRPDLDSEIAALIDECLRREPAVRPTMESVAERFGRIASSLADEAERAREVRTLLERAEAALERSDTEAARATCAQALSMSPESAEARELLRRLEEIQRERRDERPARPPLASAPPPPLAEPVPPPPPVAAPPAPRPPVAAPSPQPQPPAPPPASEPPPVEMPSQFEKVAPVSTAKRVDENVQFTLYRPDVIGPDKWYALVVFAHLASRRPDAPVDEPDPLDEVERRAQQVFGPSATPSGRADSAAAIPEEGQLRIVPTVPGIEFNPPEYRFVWLESVHQADFRIRAHGAPAGTVARGRIAVYLDVLVIAEITVAIRVEAGASAREPNTRDVFNPYRRIFASYSHKDEAVVRQFEKYAAGMGDRYMRDVIELRAGERWQPRLCEMIESADVFQLFWSTNSIASEFVRQEWEHALTVSKRNFIRPLYWELPFPKREGLPPPSLEAIQFAFVGEREPAAAPDTGTPPDISMDAILERERQSAMEAARLAELERARWEEERRRVEMERARQETEARHAEERRYEQERRQRVEEEVQRERVEAERRAREDETRRRLETERAEEARRAAEMERARQEAEARRAAEERARRDEEERLRAQEEGRRAEIDRMRRDAQAVEARRREEERQPAERRAREEYASEIPQPAPRTKSAAPARTMSPRLWPIVLLAAVAILLVIVVLRSC